MNDRFNLSGKTFGRLNVLEYAYSKNSRRYWKCKCKCGNVVYISTNDIKNNHTKSCGCLRKEVAKKNFIESHTTHNLTNTRLYNIWRSMKKRCYLKTHQAYKDYGGRGIKVCDEWKNDFMSFYNWAIENGYKEGLTIDRINNNGNYEPSNCRWTTLKEQQFNKRNNIFLTYNNETKNIYEWSAITGIKYCTIWWRYKIGWKIEDILERSPNEIRY